MTAKVHHADLWGLREVWQEDARGERQLTGGKYEWLYENRTKTTQRTTVEPKTPLSLFVRQDSELRDEHQPAWKVTEFMRVNSVGIATARDKLTIHWNDEDVWKVICDFRASPPEEARAKGGVSPMNTNGPFDCVGYKRRLQAKHAAECGTLSPEEKSQRRTEWLSRSDNPAARLWREMQKKRRTAVTARPGSGN